MGCGASRIAAQIGEPGYITHLSIKIKSCYSYQLDSRRDEISTGNFSCLLEKLDNELRG